MKIYNMSMGSKAAHNNASQSCLIGEEIHIIIEKKTLDSWN